MGRIGSARGLERMGTDGGRRGGSCGAKPVSVARRMPVDTDPGRALLDVPLIVGSLRSLRGDLRLRPGGVGASPVDGAAAALC